VNRQNGKKALVGVESDCLPDTQALTGAARTSSYDGE